MPRPVPSIRDTTMTLPRLADDVRLLGRYPGSGFREPRYLIERHDERMLQVSRLLFIVAANLDGRHSASEVAERVSTQYRRRLTAEGLEFLVEAKLRPLGLVHDDAPGRPRAAEPERHPAGAVRPHPTPPRRLLGLRLRVLLLPTGAVRFLAAALTIFFVPVVVVAGLATLAAVDVWLVRTASLEPAMAVVLTEPVTILLLLAILAASVLVHEFGHAAACRYGGGRPGAIGVGLYLVYPAFYTDVTDAQRLGRAARLRTDLGGVYFNGLIILAVASVYAATGYEPLVLAIVLIHLEMLQQLVPVVRLDGYYILTDLAGVPDLFDRVRPVLTSALPWRSTDPRVAELRPAARATVTAWVLLVVPTLLAVAGFIVLHTPELLRDVWHSERREWEGVQAALDAGDAALVALGLLSMMLLALPGARPGPAVGRHRAASGSCDDATRAPETGPHHHLQGGTYGQRRTAAALGRPRTVDPVRGAVAGARARVRRRERRRERDRTTAAAAIEQPHGLRFHRRDDAAAASTTSDPGLAPRRVRLHAGRGQSGARARRTPRARAAEPPPDADSGLPTHRGAVPEGRGRQDDDAP